jgi:hypothetical protein
VRHVLEADTNDKGVPNQVKLHVMTVWEKKNGAYQLLARQAVKLVK